MFIALSYNHTCKFELYIFLLCWDIFELAVPNQYCLDASKLMSVKLILGVRFWGQKPQNFMIPIYSTTVHYSYKPIKYS